VIDGQVRRSMGGALVARTPVAVLTTPGAEHPGAQALPGPRAVERVVPTAVRLARVLAAPTTGVARQDAADRAQPHRVPRPVCVPCLTLVTLECTPVDIVMSVSRGRLGFYSPRVLRLGGQPPKMGSVIGTRMASTSRLPSTPSCSARLFRQRSRGVRRRLSPGSGPPQRRAAVRRCRGGQPGPRRATDGLRKRDRLHRPACRGRAVGR